METPTEIHELMWWVILGLAAVISAITAWFTKQNRMAQDKLEHRLDDVIKVQQAQIAASSKRNEDLCAKLERLAENVTMVVSTNNTLMGEVRMRLDVLARRDAGDK